MEPRAIIRKFQLHTGPFTKKIDVKGTLHQVITVIVENNIPFVYVEYEPHDLFSTPIEIAPIMTNEEFPRRNAKYICSVQMELLYHYFWRPFYEIHESH